MEPGAPAGLRVRPPVVAREDEGSPREVIATFRRRGGDRFAGAGEGIGVERQRFDEGGVVGSAVVVDEDAEPRAGRRVARRAPASETASVAIVGHHSWIVMSQSSGENGDDPLLSRNGSHVLPERPMVQLNQLVSSSGPPKIDDS